MKNEQANDDMLLQAQRNALIDAFCSANNCGDFLEEAGNQLETRFFILDDETLDALSGKHDAPRRVQIEGWPCLMASVVSEGVYICAIATDDGPESLEEITAVCALIERGVSQKGWFTDLLGVCSDTYLSTCDVEGGGIYCLYCASPMSERKDVQFCLKLAKQVSAKNYCMYEDGFSLIIQRDPGSSSIFFNRLAHTLLAEGLIAGVSGPFVSAYSAIGCESKARAALPHPHDGMSLRFMDKRRWAMLSESAEKSIRLEGFSAEDFLSGVFKRIREYDAQNDTQYLKSVYEFLLCGKNLRTAAQRLDVHRNTLDYRIIRIGELFGIDFTDGHACFELLFSCKLYFDVIANGISGQKRRGRPKKRVL